MTVARYDCDRTGAVVCGVTDDHGVRCAMAPAAAEALPGLSRERLARLPPVVDVTLQSTYALWILADDGRLALIKIADDESG